MAPYLGGANMFAAKKKDGGYRPIAVVSKCIAYAVAARAASILRPYQFGVGVRGGCEGIIHATRVLLNDNDVPAGGKWLLQVDLENAFNKVDRSKMMEEVRHLLLGGEHLWSGGCPEPGRHHHLQHSRCSPR